ncbi:MAG: TRAP transporter substrate-binding protein [Firmicutes bacterium]|nr:TRAP transporter substrate-binding protein [Bacillota bacterium]
MQRKLFLAWLVFLITLTSSGCGKRVTDHEQIDPAEKIVIKFSHVVAENAPKGLAARRFANLVAARTNGRVEVQVYPNSTLYKDGEEIEALKNGSVQIIAPTTAKIAALFPRWQIFDIPYVFTSAEMVYRAMDGKIGGELFDELATQGFRGLAFWGNGFKQMTNGIRPLREPGDFKGLTMRVMMGSQILPTQFQCLGAQPVQLGFNDLYAALAQKIIDGQENTMSNIYSKKFYEVQPYLTLSNHGYMGYVVLTNRKFWDHLPPDIRGILEKAMQEVTVWEREQASLLDEESFRAIRSTGQIRLHLQTEEEKRQWLTAFTPLYRQAEEIVGSDLWRAVQVLKEKKEP